MHRRLLLLLTGCFVGCLAAFDVEKAEISVKIVGTVVTITVPENPDVQSIFFSTELSDECAAGYIFAQTLNNTNLMSYKHDLKRQLNPNEILQVSGVFEVNDQVITHAYQFRIDAAGQGVKQNASVLPNPVCPTRTTKPIQTFTSSSTCIPSERDSDRCSGKLIFREDFNDTQLKNWRHAIYSSAHSDDFECTAYVKSHAAVKDSQLHIEAKANNYRIFYLPDCNAKGKPQIKCGKYFFTGRFPTPPFYSGKIRSTMSSFKYGRYEIRAKMPKGDYLFPYIMLQPIGVDIGGKLNTNIRIAYARGNVHLEDVTLNDMAGSTVFGSAIFPYNGLTYIEVKKSQAHTTPGAHFGDNFHDYTMIWHKDRIIFKVDGKTYGTITDKAALEHLDTHESYHLVLGLTVGGIQNFPTNRLNLEKNSAIKIDNGKALSLLKEHVSSHPWTQPKLIIDHVHVYETHNDEV